MLLTFDLVPLTVLHKYGGLLGPWQADITHYGGLVQVMVRSNSLSTITRHTLVGEALVAGSWP